MLSIISRQIPDLGVAYSPAEDGPFPTIVCLHGSEGGWSGWSHRNAVIFAAHGFLAYPHVYSQGGNPWNAGSIRDAPLDKTAEAIETLRANPACTGSLGMYGVSRGAEHALLVTSLMAMENHEHIPNALAVHSPSDVICGAFDARRWRDRGDPGWRCWDPKDRAWTWRGSSEELKPTTAIEIERYDGPIFLSHGCDDPVWDVAMSRRLRERLAVNGREPEVHFYENQGHICVGEAENDHHRHLIAFFNRTLV